MWARNPRATQYPFSLALGCHPVLNVPRRRASVQVCAANQKWKGHGPILSRLSPTIPSESLSKLHHSLCIQYSMHWECCISYLVTFQIYCRDCVGFHSLFVKLMFVGLLFFFLLFFCIFNLMYFSHVLLPLK